MIAFSVAIVVLVALMREYSLRVALNTRRGNLVCYLGGLGVRVTTGGPSVRTAKERGQGCHAVTTPCFGSARFFGRSHRLRHSQICGS